MKYLKLNGNNVDEIATVAILSCIGNIDKLSGIEKFRGGLLSKKDFKALGEIVNKLDHPVMKLSIK